MSFASRANLSDGSRNNGPVPLYGGTVPGPAQRAPNKTPLYGGTVPSPAQRQPNPYVPPRAPANPGGFGGGGMSFPIGGGGGGGGMPGGGMPEPPAPPAMSEGDWLAGDGEYQNQMTEFDNTLKDFLARLATQKSDFTADFDTASRGLAQNKDRGMLQVGEDFTSRGLANSGLFNNAREETGANFKSQETGLTNAKNRAFSDFGNQETDKRKATEQAKGNAKRSSLGRMSMNQQF